MINFFTLEVKKMSYAETELIKYFNEHVYHRELLKKTYNKIGCVNPEKIDDYKKIIRYNELSKTYHDEIELFVSMMTEISPEHHSHIMYKILLYPNDYHKNQTLEEYQNSISDTNYCIYHDGNRIFKQFITRGRYECMNGDCKRVARYEFGLCHECENEN